jgi:hypothetical protein
LDYGGAHGGSRVFHPWCRCENLPAEKGAVKVEIINWGLVKHPMNWVIVILMVLIFGVFVHLILDFYGLSAGK